MPLQRRAARSQFCCARARCQQRTSDPATPLLQAGNLQQHKPASKSHISAAAATKTRCLMASWHEKKKGSFRVTVEYYASILNPNAPWLPTEKPLLERTWHPNPFEGLRHPSQLSERLGPNGVQIHNVQAAPGSASPHGPWNRIHTRCPRWQDILHSRFSLVGIRTPFHGSVRGITTCTDCSLECPGAYDRLELWIHSATTIQVRSVICGIHKLKPESQSGSLVVAVCPVEGRRRATFALSTRINEDTARSPLKNVPSWPLAKLQKRSARVCRIPALQLSGCGKPRCPEQGLRKSKAVASTTQETLLTGNLRFPCRRSTRYPGMVCSTLVNVALL